MIFPNAEHQVSAPVNHAVAIPQVNLWSQRPRLAAGVLTVHALVSKVGEHHHTVRHHETGATILVNPSADVEGRGRNIGSRAVGCAPNNDVTSAFLWPHLDPVNVITVKLDLPKTNRVGNNEICGYRRFPRAIWGGSHCHYLNELLDSRCTARTQYVHNSVNNHIKR